ncbi:MAG: Luciferase-like monooxygenase YhbW [uncultured Chloroflexi bacterium]|uniref:Luciferase-like monooxygenase YhbW n=1 Tax=uncultured Chloroflexota bacterium TaxID=166587 RepID=A0A6J4J8F4_9CHLR|nr:MAG: Luciferase-like monooxygenase YhbW [uncultured Chloroflexota bacterium]
MHGGAAASREQTVSWQSVTEETSTGTGARAEIALSVLDQSPVGAGRSARDALEETLQLAQLAERLGYRRYWLAEHHNTTSLAGSAPEVLIARVASVTERIRVGSGGVMLSHYSPLKVAETFRLLHALFPGRIDLGVGRAPGSDQRTAYALAQGRPMPIERFPEQLRDLEAYLTDRLPDDHPFRGVRALPEPPEPVTTGGESGPELWLLGSSDQSAAYAAQFGFAFSFAHFINPHGSAQVITAYRDTFRPSTTLAAPRASLAVRALCAQTDAEARRLASSFLLGRLRMERGERGPLPSVEEALAYPYTALEQKRLETLLAGIVVGSPERVKAQLERMARAHGVDELVLVTIVHDPAARRRSYELLAEAFGLT